MLIASKKRLFTTSIGIILAIATIFATYTLGNNAATVRVYEDLENEDVHAFAVGNTNATNFDEMLGNVKNISHIDVWGNLKIYGIIKGDEVDHKPFRYFNEMYYPSNIRIIKGRMPSNTNEVSLLNDTASYFGLNIGDLVNITLEPVYEFYDHPENRIVKPRVYGERMEGINHNITVTVVGIHEGRSDFVLPFEMIKDINTAFTLNVKYDVDYLIKSPDLNDLKKKISDLENNVYFAVSPYSSHCKIYRNVDISTSPFDSIIPLFFALPIIGIGVYLSKVGLEIELYERRREFGILKVRGATNSQQSKILFIELITYSIVGGIIGYLLGESMAYVANVSIMKFRGFSLELNYSLLIASIILSMFLLFIIAWKPWKRFRQTSLPSLLGHYSEEFERVSYNPNRDIVICIFFWIYLFIGSYLFEYFSPEGGLSLIMILAYIISFTLPFLFPIILVFLPLATSRLLTLGTSKPYRWISRKLAKIFKTSGDLAEKGFQRSPRRNSSLAFILAFVLTIAIFTATISDNGQRINEMQEIKECGSDMKVYLSQGYNWSFVSKILKDSENISSFAIVGHGPETEINGEVVYIGVTNITDYKNTVKHLNWFIEDGEPGDGDIAITKDLAKSIDAKTGSDVYVKTGEKLERFRVGCTVYSFPGIDFEAIVDNTTYDVRPEWILIKSENLDKAKAELSNTFGTERFTTANEYEDNFPFQFLISLLFFMIAIGIAAIIVVQYSSLLNRRGEIILYKVRGAKNRQITSLLLIEGFSVIAISLIVGAIVGLALSYFLLEFIFVTSEIPHMFTIGKYFAFAIFSLLFSYILAQYILSYIFARGKISKIIRSMGGEE